MLHYTIHGKDNPNAILLIHGFPMDGSMWSDITDELAQDFKVIVPDLPGAGQSQAYDGTLSMDIMANSILDILNQESIDKCVLAGHSMGGYVSLACLSLFPQRLKGISLVHSLASPDTEEKKQTRLKSMALINNSEKGKSEFLKGLSQNLLDEDFAKDHPQLVAGIYNQGMSLSSNVLINFYTAIMNRADSRPILSKNDSVPIQWIIGTSDKATPYGVAIEEVNLSTINEVTVLEDVGHMSSYERPEELVKSLSSFCHFCYER